MASYKGSHEEVIPKEYQAITIDASEGITLEEYAVAIGDLIGPSNIRFAIKNADGKLCFYLNSQETVSNLLDAHKHVEIGNQTSELQLLLPRYKMIVISNISPIVPHSIIEDKLTEINVTRRSSIYFMTAGIKKPGYEHIRSSHRCVWINAQDVNKLVNAVQINFEDIVYWIHWQECKGRDLYVKEIKTLGQKLTALEERMLQLKELPVPPSEATVPDEIIHQENQGLNEENQNLKQKPSVSGRRVLPTFTSDSSLYNFTWENK